MVGAHGAAVVFVAVLIRIGLWICLHFNIGVCALGLVA